MQTATASPAIPTGAYKRFGHFGPTYQVGNPVRRLDNGDWLVKVTLVETGEESEYKLSQLADDPEAN